MVLKECVVCGGEFDARGTAKTCSPECRKENKLRKRRDCYKSTKKSTKKYITWIKVCEWCGNYFEVKSNIQKYCCKKHKDAYYRYANHDRINELRRINYQNNQTRELERAKKYREKNRDKINEHARHYHWKNRDKKIEYLKKWRDENRDKIHEHDKKYYKNNRDKYREYAKAYRKKNIDKYREYEKERSLRFLNLNAELTDKNKREWGVAIRFLETKNSKYDYFNGFHAHHILPMILYPNHALDDWNGVPLPIKWHFEFHRTHNNKGSRDWLCDWVGELFDFIETKIHESNTDLVLLDQWIEIPIEGGI